MVSTRPPNSWRPHSLRTRFVAIILLALVPGFAIILLLILFGGARETRLEAARSAVGTYGRLIAQLHEQTLDESAGILVSLSLHPAVKDQDRVRCDAMLARALRRMAGFSVLLVLAPNGDVVCSSTPVDEPTNLAFRTDFKRAMETKQFSIGDYMVGRVSRQAVLPIAYPALSETGHVRFLVVAGKRLDRLDQRIARLGLPAGTEVRVLDQNGALLARLPERNRDLGRPISNPAVAKEVAGRDHGVFEAVAEDGRRRIYGFRRVNTAGSDITVIASVPRAQALAAVKSINKVFFFGALLSGSVFMLIMWLLSSRMIFRPLGQLITAIRRLRTGDLGARTGVANPIGELDEVALAFDDMAVAIQEREARLAGVMDNIADGVVTIDEAGVIESVNQRIEEMFGYEPDELIGRNMKSLMPEPYRSEHEAHFRRYIECGAPERLGLGPKDLVGERKDRSSFPISLALSEMTLGERRLFIGTLHDITHRRANEAQLLHAQKMDAIGQLTGGVAHDFNNLLTVVTGNLQLLNRTLDEPDRRKKWVETALHASSRGAELTNRLLAFSRRQVLDPRVLNVNELVAGTDSLLCRTLGESIETETVLGAGLWHTEIDPGQLETALLNLAINARDAMPDGGKLTIETRNAHLDDDYA
ncbi:MAG: PAS domain S-box protein, partial [Desulfuromonadales bacterium]|nr:PAS domain S-box protein [Desulfuromonadales bacterium]